MGSTDITGGMVTGETLFKVPSTIKFNFIGKWVSGKDIILWIIKKIGVSGALYKAMEFDGDGLKELSMDDRFTIANMAIEAGGKNGIFAVDEKALSYLEGRINRDFQIYHSDIDAEYEKIIEVDLSKIELMLAFPHLPSNARPVRDSGKVDIDEVFIGSCTNGRLSDLEVVARILKGKKVAKWLRVLIIPATPKIYEEAMDRGYLKIFLDAGCGISTPTCGACGGGHMGLVGKGEKILSTSNIGILLEEWAIFSQKFTFQVQL